MRGSSSRAAPRPAPAAARAEICARLEARREEIEAAALARVRSIADPAEIADPAYAEGLGRALTAALSHGLDTLGRGEGQDPPIPVELLAQARLAARNAIPLGTVLRRYISGYSLLGFYLIEEASRDGLLSGAELQRLTATQAGRFDRLLAAVGEEYAREAETSAQATGERRRAERIERLLAGEPVDTSEIPYDFEGWHVGVVAKGPQVERTIRELATSHDCRLLLVRRAEGTVWAWLGSRRRLDPAELLRAPTLGGVGDETTPNESSPTIVFGEPAERLTGWRLTHHQAAAVLPIAHGGSSAVLRYADGALLAAVARNDLLTSYLRERYLAPLEADRDGGTSAQETLRAYFAAARNLSSAAAMMGISRQAVRGRLRTIGQRIGVEPDDHVVELELALRLHDLESVADRNVTL